jgi:hypothetical protein
LLQIIGPALSRTFINDGQPIKNQLLLGIWALSTREGSVKWQIVLGLEAAVKHTYFLFHTFFMEICVDSLHKICFYFSGTAHNLCS